MSWCWTWIIFAQQYKYLKREIHFIHKDEVHKKPEV